MISWPNTNDGPILVESEEVYIGGERFVFSGKLCPKRMKILRLEEESGRPEADCIEAVAALRQTVELAWRNVLQARTA